MSALPYLHDSEPEMGRRAVEIESETFPLSYLHLDKEDHFEDLREIACDPENIMPPSDVRITWQLVNGWEYIYNTEKISPRQAFQPLIDSFRGLRRLALPERQFVWNDPARAPRRHPHGTAALYEAETELWRAMCGLADLYLETGWDVNAVAQTNFRTSDFIHRRTRYMQEVISPLEDQAYQAREDARKLHEA
ncbi:hypothetical protein D0867_07526 [Hortaea werneckii]|nr:hypothetical protein D0867_07526 [Hortaea werneckii]